MTLPSLEDRLARVLTDASDALPAPHLASGAWSLARLVRRRRRRAATGAVVLSAAAAVAAVLVLPGALSTTARPVGVAVTPKPTPVTVPQGTITHALWDPATFASLPALDLGLGDLRPDPTTAVPIAQAPLDRALAVVKEYGAGGTFYALGEDGRWRSVATGAVADIDNSGLSGQPHEPPLRGPFLRPRGLSSDGRYVALEGHSYVEVYDLATATGHRVDGHWFDELWTPDDRLLLKGGHDASYDPATGLLGEPGVKLGPPDRPIVADYTPDGTYSYGAGGYTLPDTRAQAELLILRAVIPLAVAAGRSGDVGLATGSGLLALLRHRTSGADLSITAGKGYLAATERLVPRFWLDQDTLVFSLRPDHGPGSGTWDTPGAQLLVAWTPSTGKLERILATTNQWRDVSLAEDLLRRD